MATVFYSMMKKMKKTETVKDLVMKKRKKLKVLREKMRKEN